MCTQLILKKQIEDCGPLRGTPPGIFDFDYLVDQDTDGHDIDGRLLFKFRKNVVPSLFNDCYPTLSDICVKRPSLRSDAAGFQTYEESRIIGYDLDFRMNAYVSETGFTRHEHRKYKSLVRVIEHVNDLYRSEFPKHYYFQEGLNVDPHFLIGTSVFSQSIFNKSFRTCLHRDSGNVEGSLSNMICLGDESYTGGFLVMPEYRVAINMRPKDYLGFLGRAKKKIQRRFSEAQKLTRRIIGSLDDDRLQAFSKIIATSIMHLIDEGVIK